MLVSKRKATLIILGVVCIYFLTIWNVEKYYIIYSSKEIAVSDFVRRDDTSNIGRNIKSNTQNGGTENTISHKVIKRTKQIATVNSASYKVIKRAEQVTTVNPVSYEVITEAEKITKSYTCKPRHHHFFPLCSEKMQFMRLAWKNKCYQEFYGVDGSECSLLKYLTEVEPFCAPNVIVKKEDQEYASPRYDLEGMLKHLPSPKFDWMRNRAKQLWNDWIVAGKTFVKRRQKWKKKKVLVFMGGVGASGFLAAAGHGGPLGEIIQWTDLISGLYILGYELTVTLSFGDELDYLGRDTDGCAEKSPEKNVVDVIYADISSLSFLIYKVGTRSVTKYKCMYRLLDSFGTFPEFNYPNYAYNISGGRSPWGNNNLVPSQFLTLYPHTHDNSFLGFVVGSNMKDKNINRTTAKKDNALIYAKLSEYFEGKELIGYLKIISEYFEIHATAVGNNKVPSFIVNHGSVSGLKVQELLLESKLFIGVGFPYEGPGPIEAMAAGTVYLQPKFDVPRNRVNEEFFQDKPTFRKLTSQSPYMEEFVGEPYCYTIDIKNETLLRKTLLHIKHMKQLPPKIPKEFTNEGLLERIHVFTEHVDYCNPDAPRWPPVDHLQVFVANIGQSCKDICMSKNLVCERTYFDDINSHVNIERFANITCSSVKEVAHLHPPSYDAVSKICYVQGQGQLYSCMHEDGKYRQLCPCRDYEMEQAALCKGCL